MAKTSFELHVITSGERALSELVPVMRSMHQFITAIQLREPARTARELFNAVEELLDAGVPVSKVRVNDRVDVAVASGAGGVHLAGHSLPIAKVKQLCGVDRPIGKSVHSLEEAKQAERDGVSYVIYGHIYATGSKPGLEPRGLEELARITRSVSVPVIAIGGITPDRVQAVMEAGAAGIAVMSGVLGAVDPVEAAGTYAEAIERAAGMRARGLKES